MIIKKKLLIFFIFNNLFTIDFNFIKKIDFSNNFKKNFKIGIGITTIASLISIFEAKKKAKKIYLKDSLSDKDLKSYNPFFNLFFKNEIKKNYLAKNLKNDEKEKYLFIDFCENNFLEKEEFFKKISDLKYQNLGFNLILNEHKKIFGEKIKDKIDGENKDLLEVYMKEVFYLSYLKRLLQKNFIIEDEHIESYKIKDNEKIKSLRKSLAENLKNKEYSKEIKNLIKEEKKNLIISNALHKTEKSINSIEKILREKFFRSGIELMRKFAEIFKKKYNSGKIEYMIYENNGEGNIKVKNVPVLICNYPGDKFLKVASDEHDCPLAYYASLAKIYKKDKNGKIEKDTIITGDYLHRGNNDTASLIFSFYRGLLLENLIRGNHESYGMSRQFEKESGSTETAAKFFGFRDKNNDIDLRINGLEDQKKIDKYFSEIFPAFSIFKLKDKKILFSHGYFCDSLSEDSLKKLNEELNKLKEGEEKLIFVEIIPNKNTKDYYNFSNIKKWGYRNRFQESNLIASSLCDIRNGSTENTFNKPLGRYLSDPENHSSVAHKMEGLNCIECYSGHNNNRILQKQIGEDGKIPYPKIFSESYKDYENFKNDSLKFCCILPVHDCGNDYSNYKLNSIYKTGIYYDNVSGQIRTKLFDLFGREIEKKP